ncbi:MAG: hypothetical protein OXC37_04680, partial [Bdellovibrionaceae bacterium]|nr:hypothetical protein [Pseudobdellovibrionaceae bacterium]
MASLISSVNNIQKEVCSLGARDCKGFCENKLNDFKKRVKNCFSISSSIDKALKEVRKAGSNSSCYSELKDIADKYKRQSRKGGSELREDLSSQDIVDCEGLKDKESTALATTKIMGICNEANRELLERRKQEEERKAEEERKKREEERKAQLER